VPLEKSLRGCDLRWIRSLLTAYGSDLNYCFGIWGLLLVNSIRVQTLCSEAPVHQIIMTGRTGSFEVTAFPRCCPPRPLPRTQPPQPVLTNLMARLTKLICEDPIPEPGIIPMHVRSGCSSTLRPSSHGHSAAEPATW